MAYPLLNSLTFQTADRIRSLIDYAQNMTKSKYFLWNTALVQAQPTLNSLERL